VRWADISERGYAVLDLAPDRAVVQWWHLDPFARSPSEEARFAAAFAVSAAADPPALEPVALRDLRADPVRPGLPSPLPPRPSDLDRLRRWRRRQVLRTAVRRGAKVGGAGAVAAGALVSRRRRRS
jgi:hypothetical protein